MNKLQIFKSQQFGEIRWVKIDNKDYAVGIDIARALGYKDPNSAISRHCKGSVKHPVGVVTGKKQNGEDAIQNVMMNCITEGDIYRLVTHSELPSAEEFESWIFDEVLPTIRKTGGYVSNDDLFINTYLPYADETTKAMFKGTLELVRKQNEAMQIMKPKSDYFDALVERNLLTNFRDTSKELKVPERTFIQWLLDKKFIYRDIKGKALPYAKYVPDIFQLKEWSNDRKSGNQTLITPKGRETFRLLLIKDGLTKEAM